MVGGRIERLPWAALDHDSRWESAARSCSQVLIDLPLLSKGSKGTNNKEGGGSTNSRGGSTPPALGDLFAGGFPVLRPAGQRDAAGKEELRPAALWPLSPSLVEPTGKSSHAGTRHVFSEQPWSRRSSVWELKHWKLPEHKIVLAGSF